MSRNLPLVHHRDVATILVDFDTAYKIFKELMASPNGHDMVRLRTASDDVCRLSEELTHLVAQKVAATNHDGAIAPAIFASS